MVAYKRASLGDVRAMSQVAGIRAPDNERKIGKWHFELHISKKVAWVLLERIIANIMSIRPTRYRRGKVRQVV
jgi:hypothetical protein